MSKCSGGKSEFPGRAKVCAKSQGKCNKFVGGRGNQQRRKRSGKRASESGECEHVSVGTGCQWERRQKTVITM